MSEKMNLQQLLREKANREDMPLNVVPEAAKQAQQIQAGGVVTDKPARGEVTIADLEKSGMNYVTLAQAAGEEPSASAARIIKLLKAVEQQAVASPATGAVLTTQFANGNKPAAPAQPAGNAAPTLPSGPSR